MNEARRPLALALFLAFAFPLAAAEKTEKAEKKAPPAKVGAPKEKAKTAPKVAKDAPKETGSQPPPADNLVIPADLPEKPRKGLEEAVAAFEEAQKVSRGGSSILDKAIDKLKAASQSLPKSPIPSYYLGIAYQMKRNYPEARRVLEKAVKLNPRFHEAYVELADVHVWQRDAKGSLAVYDKALAIDPTYTLASRNKALALIRLGQFQDAKPYLEKTIKEQPKDEGLRGFSRMLDDQIKGPAWERTFIADSKNYQVKTCVSQEYADEIAHQAELMRRAYDKVFPWLEKPKRKFPIWVYPDRAGYLKGGGPQMAGGHYEPVFRKLVLYRYPKKEETITVLHHEAFHQYIHDYLEEIPQWFNEGMADYFGAFEYVKKGQDERMVCRPNRGRLMMVKAAIGREMCPSAAELMAMTQAEMYEESMVGVHYAQAWAMIYFVGEGPNPQYKVVLNNYFKSLDKGLDLNEAFKASFGKIDMDRFDKEWKAFIKGVK